MKEFKDRTAVVTGAASGIGRAMVASFLDAGMKVVLADIEEEKLENAVNSFKESGGNVFGVPMDVSDPEQVQALAQKTLEKFGAIHVLCNNAGIGYAARSSWETPLEVWKMGSRCQSNGCNSWYPGHLCRLCWIRIPKRMWSTRHP